MDGNGLRLRVRSGHPDFLDLPWHQPLEEWQDERLVEVARGLHRHVVRFVELDGRLYALKQMPARLVEREYGLLRRMHDESLPVVEAVGVAARPEALEDVLITRYLDYCLPYRTLFSHQYDQSLESSIAVEPFTDRLLDALAMLLVRLHLAGVFWGDCSLSNTLFRRDAGALAAYVVDLETGEWHARLTDGQRAADLMITEQNVTGGLLDLQAEFDLPPDPNPLETAANLEARYQRVWDELTTEEWIEPGDRYRIEARMRRLNELGFDVDEIDIRATAAGDRLVFNTVVTEQGHHRRRLLALTGLEAQENQARSLLNDMANFRAALERAEGRPLPEALAAYRWLNEIFEPTIAAVPDELRAKRQAAELFHEIVEHKWFLSEAAGADVGMSRAVDSYLGTVLPATPDERAVLVGEDDTGEWIGFG